MYDGMICPNCQQQTGIDPAFIETDKPCYCPFCNEQIFFENMDEDDDEEKEFIRCDKCDGHDACEDYGCAFDLGLGHLVKRDNGNFEW